MTFAAQSRAGDHLYATVQLISHDEKRFRMYLEARRADDDSLVVTSEFMMLHVDTRIDKACAMDAGIIASLDAVAAAHNALPQPSAAGRAVGQKR